MSIRSRAILATVAVMGALVATVVVVQRPGTSALVAVDGEPNGVVGTYVPSPAATLAPAPPATPKPAPTTSAATPRPTATRTGTRVVANDSWNRKEPGAVTFPYEPGRSSWTHTTKGVRITLSVTPAHPRVGERTVWRTTMTSADERCCLPAIGFSAARSPTSSVDCAAAPVSSAEFAVTFNRAARQEFFIQALLGCDGGSAVFYGVFDVAPGARSGQGPEKPVVQFDDSSRPAGHEEDYSWVSLFGIADDPDGHITRLVVSFGDGTTKTFANTHPCEVNDDGWPAASQAHLPSEPPYAHHYTKPGDYTLTLTAYSSSCDGRDVQTGSASFVWTAP